MSAAPDLEIVIEDIVSQGNMVAGRWISRWTDVSGIAGSQPTGKQIEVTGMDMCRIADGKIAERWWAKDVLGAMQQLGVVPPLTEKSKE
jgi:predicted ester cyclase